MGTILESHLEQAALTWFAQLGYEILDPDHLDPESPYQERQTLEQVVLEGRLREALHRLNPEATPDAVDEALRRLRRHEAPTLIQNNLAFHRHLTDGITIEVPSQAGGTRGLLLRLVDFDQPKNNDWLVTHQLNVVDRITGTGKTRIPDIVVYLNGLPIAVFELKRPTDPNADIWQAYKQLQTYLKDIPSLFVTNAILAISDDVHARIAPLTAPDARYAPWRTIDGQEDAPATEQPLKVLIHGVFHPKRLLDLIRNFITFEHERGQILKKLAAYHQFYAVRRALEETLRASQKGGDKRIGVVWHTQGSGKSLTMLFYARKLILEPAMENPTIVVLTDRNDLDGQLFGTFSRSQALLRQEPVQAKDRPHLRELLKTASGGVYFTTIQKFLPDEGETYPTLSDRHNIVVIADEAHRSQYGFKGQLDTKTGKMVYGYAKHLRDALPKASYIGFTGTPIELEDKSTIQVFGDTFSVYDIKRAVEDHATVPIYYESRHAKLDLDDTERPCIDPNFEEVTEGEEEAKKEALKSEWSSIEALAGTPKRLAIVAKDLVEHFEKRLGSIEGKALVVCMSRRIAAELYEAIVKLRPAWHDADDDAGAIKVVITGSAADEEPVSSHVRGKTGRERLAERFKDPKDPLKMVLVRDMWLTGFDAPCLHTLYVDKPMRGHTLMQAIARVNRVFGDKPGGLVVDYIGIGSFLKEAMHTYSERGGAGDATKRQDEAVEAMLQKLEVCRDLFHGFDYSAFFSGKPEARLSILPGAREHVLKLKKPKDAGKKGEPDGYDRFLQAVGDLSSAFSLAMPHDACEEAREEVAFFQAVKVGLLKLSSSQRAPSADVGHAVRQIVENAVVTEGVIDVFSAAGLPRPDISILSEEFLVEVRGMKHQNLAVELLMRLLADEIRRRRGRSIIQGRSFAELLDKAIQRYQSRSIESAVVIEELLELARRIREAGKKGEELRLSGEEFEFYLALAENESARNVMGDDKLAFLSRELTKLVRKNATIDWTQKRSVQAELRLLVKKLLRKHGYPPDAEPKATTTVLEQAKVLGINVVEGASEAEAAPGDWTGVEETPGPRALPYPIAVFDSLVACQESAVLRVKTRWDGFEKALSFLVGVELSLLREQAGGKLPDDVFGMLKDFLGKPLSMGTWVAFAWQLAARLPGGSKDPEVRAARALVNPQGKPSDLTRELEKIVQDRNAFAHSVMGSEEAVAEQEGALHDLWRRFTEAMAPLGELTLVSRAGIAEAEPGKGAIRYKVRVHQGAQDHFPIREETVHGKLAESWCYLLREGKEPLDLAPVVACAYVKEANRREIVLPRKLEVAPGEKMEGVGVTLSNKVKLVVPG